LIYIYVIIIKTLSNMTTEINKFEIGKTYEMRFIGDSDLRPHFVCVKRTEKSATFKSAKTNEVLTRRVKVYDNFEYILQGTYSMAPSIRAKNIINN